MLKKLLKILEADIGFGDISSGIIPPTASGSAKIYAKSPGILAGMEEAMYQETWPPVYFY